MSLKFACVYDGIISPTQLPWSPSIKSSSHGTIAFLRICDRMEVFCGQSILLPAGVQSFCMSVPFSVVWKRDTQMRSDEALVIQSLGGHLYNIHN